MLDEIWLYGAGRWGYNQADVYQDFLLSKVVFLAENPDVGKNRDDIKPGYQSFPVGSHIIFFKKQGDVIAIMSFLHQSADVE